MRRSPLRAASPSTSTRLDAHHAGAAAQSGVATRAARVRELLRGAEVPLLATLLEYLGTRRDVRVLGPSQAAERAATVAFVTQTEPGEVVQALARRGFMAGHGNFYAVRLFEGMQVDPLRGAAAALAAALQLAGRSRRTDRGSRGDPRPSPHPLSAPARRRGRY